MALMPGPLAPVMRSEFPEVEDAVVPDIPLESFRLERAFAEAYGMRGEQVR